VLANCKLLLQIAPESRMFLDSKLPNVLQKMRTA